MSQLLSRTLLVHPQERRSTIYFFSLFLLIGCGMALGKGSADALFFKRYGIEFLPLVFLVQAVLLFIITTIYAIYADRWPPERLLSPLVLVLIAALFCLWLMMTIFVYDIAYPIYLLLYDISSDIFFVHCTLYLAKNFDVLQAKRLTSLILGGWQIGAVLGGILIAIVTPHIGVENIPIIWIAFLLASMFLVKKRHLSVGVSPFHRTGRRGRHSLTQAIEQISQTVTFTRRSPLLKAMSFALFFMVITYYVLGYSVNLLYTETFQTEADLAIFYGILGASTAGLALIIQIFISNRLIRRFGVTAMNMVFPSMTILGFGLLVSGFILPFAILGSVIKDAIMPAFRNPVRALFFNALPSFIQGRSHALSVGIVLPLALATAGIALIFAQQTQTPIYFLSIGLFTSIVYSICSWRMNKSYVNSIIATLKQKLYVPNQETTASLAGDENEVFKVLERTSKHHKAEIRFSAAKMLLALFPDKAGPLVLEVLTDIEVPLQDQLMHLLASLDPPGFRQKLWDEIEHEDNHLRTTILLLLIHYRDKKAQTYVRQSIADENPRVRMVGIFGALHYPINSLQEIAYKKWQDMLHSDIVNEVLAGLDLLSKKPELRFSPFLPGLLASPDVRIKESALRVFESWPNNDIDDLQEILVKLLASSHFKNRVIATKRVALLDDTIRVKLASGMINDVHPAVRKTAALALFPNTAQMLTLAAWLKSNNGSPKSQEAVLNLMMQRSPPRSIMQSIAYQMALDAKSLTQVRTSLSTFENGLNKQPGPWKLVDIVLSERCLQILDLSLLAASQYENANTIGVIRAGINSQDKRHWASTCEALRYIEDMGLAQQLVSILEYLNGEAIQPRVVMSDFKDETSIFEWAKGRGDQWLLDCVTHALHGN